MLLVESMQYSLRHSGRHRQLSFEALAPRELLTVVDADYVIAISVDGLRSDAITSFNATELPHFNRLRNEGAFTDNARTDHDVTLTLPNHTGMVTGRQALGVRGHGVVINVDSGGTVHESHGDYIDSVFDVVHDHGFSTGLYSGKDKFNLLERSWNETNGAVDESGDDDGRDKIDRYVLEADTSSLVDQFVADMAASPFHFSLLHLRDPDAAGHGFGWLSPTYLDAVRHMDGLLGKVLDLVQNSATLAGKTVVLLTSDHGGIHGSHADNTDGNNYVIPFYAWGANVAQGDLYHFNPSTKADPGLGRVDPGVSLQPIRNRDIANLTLDILNLPPLPEGLNAAQDFEIGVLKPWQNLAAPVDVNNDGLATPFDVLLVINELNSKGIVEFEVPSPIQVATFYDVNGDNRLTPLDALLGINYLNEHGSGPIFGGPPAASLEVEEAWLPEKTSAFR